MGEIREIEHGRTALATAALLELRPRWASAEALQEQIDTRLRPAGYRLAGVFVPEHRHAVSVAGFRVVHALAWGHHLYLDDLSTLPDHRGAGHADRLLDWLVTEAGRLGCESLHLDSGVGPDRAPAHRAYMRHHLRISAHHFHRDL